MIPAGHHLGQGRRAVLTALAFGVTAVIIYALFSSGFGRLPRSAAPMPMPVPVREVGPPARPMGAAVPALAVVSDDLWLTYLPRGLENSRAGGASARFGTAGRFVEARMERGTVAAGWDGYRERITVLDARATTVRGRPAVAGRHPAGGRVIVWLERPGAGAWIRVSDSLGGELAAIAASAKAPVGD